VFVDYDMDDKAIIDHAYSSVRDYQRMNKQEHYNPNNNQQRTRNNNIRNHRNNQNTKWRKPSTGVIKANSDANPSIDGWWGLGAIFRDASGEILASATWRVPGFNDPTTAEACALYYTTILAIECCFNEVDFEVDSSMVADGVNEVFTNPRSYFGNYIRGIQTNRVFFRHVTFSQISRKANSVAHGLALLAHTVPNYVWMEDTHPNIVPRVFKDLF
jgi:hypothetical protein